MSTWSVALDLTSSSGSWELVAAVANVDGATATPVCHSDRSNLALRSAACQRAIMNRSETLARCNFFTEL